MLALVLVILIPLIANVLLEKKLCAFAVSAPLGVLVLWINMIVVEQRAPDSDFDLVFGFACLFWGAVLVCAYAAVAILFALLVSGLRGRKSSHP